MEIVCEEYKRSMRKDSDNAKLLEPGELPSKRKILVVEDNEFNRDILSSSAGHWHAGNGRWSR